MAKRDVSLYIDDILDSIQRIEEYTNGMPWQKVAGLRDIIIHNYFGLMPKRIWNIIKNDIPAIKTEIEIVRKKYNQ